MVGRLSSIPGFALSTLQRSFLQCSCRPLKVEAKQMGKGKEVPASVHVLSGPS